MRKRFTEAEKRRYLTELERSGETPWRFAKRIGIGPVNLYRWMRKSSTSGSPRFAPLVRELPAVSIVSGAPGRVSIRVGDATVQVEPGFDAELLRAVVSALRGSGST
jgi:transposase-like protein